MRPFPFFKVRFFAFAFSLLVILTFWGITLMRGGFNVGIDFKSGLNIVFLFQESTSPLPSTSTIYEKLSELKGIQVKMAENSQMILRIPSTGSKDFQKKTEEWVLKTLTDSFPNIQMISSDFVGAGYSASMVKNSILLIIGTLLAVVLYLWLRFELSYAISAVLSTFHDAIVVLGFIGAFHFELNIAAVAAILTIVGYSLNDTIVTFDRIRENYLVSKRSDMKQIIELSISQTLNRTLVTSITTLLAVIPISLLSSGNIRQFSIEIIVGVLVGTYSSVFIAGVSLNIFHNILKKSDKKHPYHHYSPQQYIGSKKRKKINNNPSYGE